MTAPWFPDEGFCLVARHGRQDDLVIHRDGYGAVEPVGSEQTGQELLDHRCLLFDRQYRGRHFSAPTRDFARVDSILGPDGSCRGSAPFPPTLDCPGTSRHRSIAAACSVPESFRPPLPLELLRGFRLRRFFEDVSSRFARTRTIASRPPRPRNPRSGCCSTSISALSAEGNTELRQCRFHGHIHCPTFDFDELHLIPSCGDCASWPNPEAGSRFCTGAAPSFVSVGGPFGDPPCGGSIALAGVPPGAGGRPSMRKITICWPNRKRFPVAQ